MTTLTIIQVEAEPGGPRMDAELLAWTADELEAEGCTLEPLSYLAGEVVAYLVRRKKEGT